MNARRFWIGVVSRSHVALGVAGGYAQLGHGKEAPLQRLHAGDWLLYYSPKTALEGGAPLKAFTALGKAVDERVYRVEMSADFRPFRRDIRYLPCREAPIEPLLDELSFIRDKQRWGFPFRAGLIQIPEHDFRVIAQAMGITSVVADAA